MPRLRITLTAAAVALVAGVATALGASAPARPAGITSADTPAAAARAYMAQHRVRAGVADPGQMALAGTSPGLDGTTVVRLQQQVDGVPVLGGEAVVVVDSARRVLAADGATLADPPASVAPTVSANSARATALAAARKSLGGGLTASQPTLVVADPALLGGPGLPVAAPAWDLTVSKGTGIRRRVLVDAASGTVITMLNAVESAKSIAVCNAGSANAAYPCVAPFARVNTATPSGNAEVNSAYDLTGATYDFYAALGRDSIDNAGMQILSTVNWCPTACPYQNAFWDGAQMVFGPGFASADDVVAHELTHGVTERTSNLVYWYQSGAINEGLSDIMGELFDLQRNPTPANPWKIAEDSPLGIIRDMANPPAYGDPDRIGSANYYLGSGDSGGVHTNSGVANKAAYLIADGGTFNGQTLTGIGRTKSAVLWYQTDIALRMSSGYSDLADTVEATCANLVTLGTAGFTSADCVQVGKATTATEMRVDPVTVPAVCTAGLTGIDLFNDGFDTGLATNWTTAASVGANQWYASSAASPDGNTMHWPTNAAANARGVDSAARNDSTMTMTTGVAIPAGAATRGAYLRLTHWFQFEASDNALGVLQAYDAGVIEYSLDGSATWNDINTLAAVNGYNGTINADLASDNPLEGRPGFVTSSNGATTTRIALATLAGHTVKFRFRTTSDTGTGGFGWYIDSVRINNCVAAPSAATVTGVTPGDQSLSVAFTQGDDGGATPTNIEYSTNDGGSWTTRSPASVASPLLITGLTNGTSYPVRIRVVGPGGTGTQSNAITSAPVAPNPRTVSVTSTQAASYAIDAVAPVIAGSASAGGGSVSYASSTAPVCTIDPASGQVAFAGTGTCSITASVGISGSYQAATSAPTTFTVLPAAPSISTITGGDQSLSVAFALGPVGGVAPTNIEYSTNDGGSWTARSPASVASPLLITGLTNGTSYPVRIRVVAAAGTGGQSNAISSAPVAPVARTISITSTQAASYAIDATAPIITASPSQAGGQVSFASSTPAVCTVHATSGQVTFTGAGTCSITASVAASGALIAATSGATTFTVVGLPEAPSPEPSPAPTPTPAANPLVDAPAPGTQGTSGATGITVPATPTWAPVAAGGTATSTFAAVPGTTYAVKATRRGAPAASTAKGACKVSAATATCRVRLATAGTWTVVVTPTTGGKAGTPMRSVVKVTTKKR